MTPNALPFNEWISYQDRYAAMPAVSAEVRRELERLGALRERLEPLVEAAYAKAERTRRKRDFGHAQLLDEELSEIDEALHDALEELQQTDEEEKLVVGRAPIDRELVAIYASWLWQRSRPPGSSYYARGYAFSTPEDADENLVRVVRRHVEEQAGRALPEISDEQMIEAARDAYEAEVQRRARRGQEARPNRSYAANGPRNYRFYSDCVSWPRDDVDSLNELIRDAREVTRRTFLGYVDGAEMREIERNLGYGRDIGLTMASDWAVSYYVGTVWGCRAAFFRWSHIEHVFVDPSCRGKR